MIFDAKNSRWVKGGRSKNSFFECFWYWMRSYKPNRVFSKTGKSVRAGTKRPQMLRKPRFNLSQPSFSTSMFLKNSGRTREREWIHDIVCIENTGLVSSSSNVLTKQRRTRELFNETHHNIRLYFRRTSGPCCQWGWIRSNGRNQRAKHRAVTAHRTRT